ncbi:5-hydroxytryptamine receptor 1B-like [Strongylocentrotus purpuratus]|uniref:G-protein coupled receptors family 1 profile domain-containing protein n=1 Tax=Strongylocentrotus purpuratus TaxID=7668 RepID=A0A7M7NXD3_STRPU|nr:5-hydroxytryptamine receptor 1B-like [Strongylocentrotus purpuratus]
MVTNMTEIDIDGPDYGFEIKQRIGITVVYCLISFTGITGNICVFLAVLLSKKLHTLTNILVVNLSVIDFLTCCSILVQCVVLLTSEQFLRVVPSQLCVLTSAVNFVGVANSLMTLTLIAFMRWYVITRSIRGHRGLHTPGKIATLLIITWKVSLVSMLLPPGLGVGTLGYSAAYKQCLTIDGNQLVVYYSMLQAGGCFAFVAMAVSFYIAIFLFVRKNTVALSKNFSSQKNAKNIQESKSNLKLENMKDSSVQRLSYHVVDDRHRRSEDLHQMTALFRKREWRITKNLLVVFCIFLVCFIPFAITLAIPGGSLFTVYTTTLLYTSPCINPIVYCLKHDQFKEVFRPMLRFARNFPR